MGHITDPTPDATEGTDWTAKYRAGEWWYECAVCHKKVPYSQTTRNVQTRAHQGLRVCLRCVDEPGLDDLIEVKQARLASLAQREGTSAAKEP